jgi:hypothetical protein
LKGNLSLSDADLKSLKRHKKLLRRLTDKKESLKAKKQIIVQSGGSFLLALLPAAVAAIASLFGK